jgi:pilus assembly protein CpaB
LIVLSLILASLATLVLRGHLARLEARARSPGDAVRVVTAAAELPRGAVLDSAALGRAEVPASFLPPGAVRSPGEAVGHVLAADVEAGEVLTRIRLKRAGPVASLVTDGLRAVSVTASFPPDLLIPGDLVDVLAARADGPFAETVASGAEVLLVLGSESTEAGLGPTTTIVLLVSPSVATRLARARSLAELTLAVAPAEEGGGLQ